MVSATSERNKVELSVLKKYGLRYSVLAAWGENLWETGVAVPAGITKPLENARIMISSGCFSVGEVGADLTSIEGTLFSLATSAGQLSAENWLETLAECMSDKADVDAIEKKIGVPAVKTHFNRFDFSGSC